MEFGPGLCSAGKRAPAPRYPVIKVSLHTVQGLAVTRKGMAQHGTLSIDLLSAPAISSLPPHHQELDVQFTAKLTPKTSAAAAGDLLDGQGACKRRSMDLRAQ